MWQPQQYSLSLKQKKDGACEIIKAALRVFSLSLSASLNHLFSLSASHLSFSLTRTSLSSLSTSLRLPAVNLRLPSNASRRESIVVTHSLFLDRKSSADVEASDEFFSPSSHHRRLSERKQLERSAASGSINVFCICSHSSPAFERAPSTWSVHLHQW